MTDLLNPTEREAALALGWDVCWVYCLTKCAAIVQVLPAPNNPLKSADGLQRVVMLRAQAGEKLAQRIAQLILNPPPPRRKKK